MPYLSVLQESKSMPPVLFESGIEARANILPSGDHDKPTPASAIFRSGPPSAGIT